MNLTKLKHIVLDLLAPYPRARAALVAAYRRMRFMRFKTTVPLTVVLTLTYWCMVVPAKLLPRRYRGAFGAGRKKGWQECRITSDALADYADQYAAGDSKRASLYVRLMRSKLRALRMIAPAPEPDASRPPSDIYALF